jgi:hypothetical protein
MKELLAVVYFCKQFRYYLVGRDFVVLTDHASLQWLTAFKNPEGMLAHWLAQLQQFGGMSVVHRPGKENANADALSRRPKRLCKLDQCPICAPLRTSTQQSTRTSVQAPVLTVPEYPGQTPVKPILNLHQTGSGSNVHFNRTLEPHCPADQDNEVTSSSDEEDISPPNVLLRSHACEDPEEEEQHHAHVSAADTHCSLPPLPNGDPADEWCPSLSPAQLRKMQQEDPEINIVLQFLAANNGKPSVADLRSYSQETRDILYQWKKLHFIDGMAYRQTQHQHHLQPIMQYIVP